ncbi:cytochrome P450 [Aspergillus brunneoviolaceus CBS 621.78]|uniref:Cytochrome P450 n=1 Tax=Aspergillus brunneoviolaceus CBS 621.78 TaxID=1450534 RepID=A0ACD1G0N4_9EURO|nr:cytochrome P450 [Aspergillus brunneoviolaceus CBS 621.78]RAH42801.1 cytochrome P450 [Aspergillus brunneoviolaceus CBS 621.78]
MANTWDESHDYLTVSNFSFYGASFIFACLAFNYIRAWFFLKNFHGPWLASFSELWLAKTALSGRFHEILLDANKKPGHLVRIGPTTLLTDDPDIIRHMNNARSKHAKTDWYTFMRLNPYIDNIFSERDLAKHDQLRATMGPAYIIKNNAILERKIARSIQTFLHYIDERIDRGNENCIMDFSRACQFFTLDVITDMAFGEPFGYLATDQDLHGYHTTFAAEAPMISVINSMPTLCRFMNRDFVKKLWGPSTKDEKGIGDLMAMAESTVKKRIESGKNEQDMLGSFLNHGMSVAQAEAEILTQLSAGTDSNSAALRGTLLHIFTSPPAYNKLRAEIDEATRSGRVSPQATAAEVAGLPYLDACIREGMRIWPPFAGLNIKQVNKGGEVIKGKFIPGGTGIATSFWRFQRNPVFGEDVETFRPERWLKATPEERARMEKVNDLVFGYGRWLCLGRQMVVMEMKQVIVELLRHFGFRSTVLPILGL